MRVIFWGTPDFATAALRALLGEGFDVVGVVTQPDKAVGRSRSRLQPSPVKLVALDEGLPVLQPDKPRGEAFVAQVAALAPDVNVVVAYGHLLPRSVIELPKFGTLNIHASLLPALRGAAPIQAAIHDGLGETGVTIMQMIPKLDAGPILLQARTPVLADETAGELTLRLSELGAGTLIEALALLELGLARPQPQDESDATHAAKLTRDTARVDWRGTAHHVGSHVRAYDPKPGAWGRINGTEVKLFGARLAPRGGSHEPGDVMAIDAEGMLVACGGGAVRITAVQPAGKRRLSPQDWANGRGISVGDRFDTGAAAVA
ncbi:MAG TPA: methionyl-tRNA formyltransferase [Gemmatimonadaceae bacterium]|nr:methionyl-tRNA formyltransferase [Gemmatimonadaceae bacterium]